MPPREMGLNCQGRQDRETKTELSLNHRKGTLVSGQTILGALCGSSAEFGRSVNFLGSKVGRRENGSSSSTVPARYPFPSKGESHGELDFPGTKRVVFLPKREQRAF
jgi:hypothetical protein